MSDLAKLRHLYANLMNGGVRDTASAKRIATGLLGPVIENMEKKESKLQVCEVCLKIGGCDHVTASTGPK